MPINTFRQVGKLFYTLTSHFHKKPLTCANEIRWQEWNDDNKIYCAWIGHATLLLKIQGLFIITDPVFSKALGIPLVKYIFNIRREILPAIAIEDLPPIDIMLISHGHMDHLDKPSLKLIGQCDTLITAKHLQDLTADLSVRQAFYLDDGQCVKLEIKGQAITVQALKPKHWGTRLIKDKHRLYTAILLEFTKNQQSIFFAGDSAYTENFSSQHMITTPTLALMPISAYDPFIKAHCTPEQAIDMAINMKAQHVIGYHHETFNLSHEPLGEPRIRYESYELENKINRISLHIGESVSI